MQRKLLPGAGLLLCRAAEDRIDARGQTDFVMHPPLSLGHELRDVAAHRVAGHGLPPARAIVLDDEASRREENIGEFSQRKPGAFGIREHEIADALRLFRLFFIENDRQFEDPIPVKELRSVGALKRRLHRFQNIHRPKSKLRQSLGPDADNNPRRARRRF